MRSSRHLSCSLAHQTLVEELSDEVEFDNSPTAEDDGVTQPSTAPQEGFFEGIINFAERATGLDLDQDGDIGLPGRPSHSALTGKGRVLNDVGGKSVDRDQHVVLGGRSVDA